MPSWPSGVQEAGSRFTILRGLRSSGRPENPNNWLQAAKPGSAPGLPTLSHHRFSCSPGSLSRMLCPRLSLFQSSSSCGCCQERRAVRTGRLW